MISVTVSNVTYTSKSSDRRLLPVLKVLGVNLTAASTLTAEDSAKEIFDLLADDERCIALDTAIAKLSFEPAFPSFAEALDIADAMAAIGALFNAITDALNKNASPSSTVPILADSEARE